ncbi:MAG: hypothetical protein AAF081_17100 [Actinomycetota bacterium]
MAITITEIGFHRDEHQLVVAAMQRLDRRGDGEGWINLSPLLTDEEQARVPERTTLGDFFAGRGPAVAMATWTPAVRGTKPRPAQMGIEHGTGPKALDRLAEVGVALPQGWVKRQDHAKHGIVAELPDGENPSVVITWMIVASTLLRTVVEPGDDWLALVHEPDA